MSNISDHSTLLLLLAGVGTVDLLDDFWAEAGDLWSPRRVNDCIVWPKRLTAPFLTGEIKFAKDVTRARGRTLLLLGSSCSLKDWLLTSRTRIVLLIGRRPPISSCATMLYQVPLPIFQINPHPSQPCKEAPQEHTGFSAVGSATFGGHVPMPLASSGADGFCPL